MAMLSYTVRGHIDGYSWEVRDESSVLVASGESGSLVEARTAAILSANDFAYLDALKDPVNDPLEEAAAGGDPSRSAALGQTMHQSFAYFYSAREAFGKISAAWSRRLHATSK